MPWHSVLATVWLHCEKAEQVECLRGLGRLSAGVGRKHPVTIRKASLMAGSIRRVWALWHQAGAQYSAVECTRARVAIRRVVAPAPQPEPASRLSSAMRDVSFLQSDSRCRRYVSDLSNVTSRYLGSEQKGRVSLLKLTFLSRLATLLLRWKAADTVFVVLSFGIQVWSYSHTVAMSLPNTPSTACQSVSACMIARSSSHACFLEMVVGKSEMQVLKRRGGRTDPCGTPLIMLKYINSLITTACFWHCINQEISKKLFLLQTCDLSKIIVKSQQWRTPSESIAIYWVKETSFACYTSSVLRKIRHTNK